MRRVIIGKNHFAVGLQWGLGSSRLTQADLRQEARLMDPAFDALAFRQRQHGFAASGGNVSAWRNVRALAASVQVPSPSFLGLFQLEDAAGPFWWMFAMSQSLIVGMGDRVFPSRESAESAIRSLRGLMDADFEEKVVCETLSDSLEWLSPLLDSWVRARLLSGRSPFLVPLHPRLNRRKTVVLVAGMLAGLAGGSLVVSGVWEHREEQKRAEKIRQAKAGKEQQRRELQAHPEKIFPKAWLSAPDVALNLRPAVRALLSLPTVVNGWELEGLSWDTSHIVASWSFRPGASYASLPNGARLDSAQKCTSRLPAPASRSFPGTEQALLSGQECTQLFYQAAQLIGCRLKLSFNSPERKVVDNVEVVCPWRVGQWEFHSIPAAVIADAMFPDVFTSMPGIVLRRIELNKDVWSMKGEVYVIN